jgi:hypothetical protein
MHPRHMIPGRIIEYIVSTDSRDTTEVKRFRGMRRGREDAWAIRKKASYQNA